MCEAHIVTFYVARAKKDPKEWSHVLATQVRKARERVSDSGIHSEKERGLFILGDVQQMRGIVAMKEWENIFEAGARR